ncbi:hypothetical protein SAMN05216367_5924 [Tardiphaga sp. OK245]|jgi:hypothetical protein|nr:hypothetical protein SAMN05216367_5924 [Tardiphaga sp. OK245]
MFKALSSRPTLSFRGGTGAEGDGTEPGIYVGVSVEPNTPGFRVRVRQVPAAPRNDSGEVSPRNDERETAAL